MNSKISNINILGNSISNALQLYIGLTRIYGIGISTSKKICSTLGIDPLMRLNVISSTNVVLIEQHIQNNYLIGNELKNKVRSDINALKSMRHRRGLRLMAGLPCRGQKTRSNARTARMLNRV